MDIDILSEKNQAGKRLDQIMSEIARTMGTSALIGLVKEFRHELAGSDSQKIVNQWEQVLRVVKVLDEALVFVVSEQDIFSIDEN